MSPVKQPNRRQKQQKQQQQPIYLSLQCCTMCAHGSLISFTLTNSIYKNKKEVTSNNNWPRQNNKYRPMHKLLYNIKYTWKVSIIWHRKSDCFYHMKKYTKQKMIHFHVKFGISQETSLQAYRFVYKDAREVISYESNIKELVIAIHVLHWNQATAYQEKT